MKKVFLTGATGFVGGALARLLVERGCRVTAAIRESSRADRVPEGCDPARVDFLDPDSLAPRMEGADVIQHVAGAVKARCQEDFDLANAATTAALVRAAEKACPGALFVLTSSQSAAGPCGRGPVTAYGRSKLLAERAATGFANRVIVRPPAVFGPGDEATRGLFRWAGRGLMATPRTRGAFCAVFVEDLAHLLAEVMDRPEVRGAVLQPSYPETITWKDFHRAMELAAGRRILHLRIPTGLIHAAGAMAEAAASVTGACPFVTRDKARELTAETWVIRQDEVEAVLGWTPRTPLVEALRVSLESSPSKGYPTRQNKQVHGGHGNP
jgi:nucleoside-diphosphate-sugar epimerase